MKWIIRYQSLSERSDTDGISDGAEVEAGTDPLVPEITTQLSTSMTDPPTSGSPSTPPRSYVIGILVVFGAGVTVGIVSSQVKIRNK